MGRSLRWRFCVDGWRRSVGLRPRSQLTTRSRSNLGRLHMPPTAQFQQARALGEPEEPGDLHEGDRQQRPQDARGYRQQRYLGPTHAVGSSHRDCNQSRCGHDGKTPEQIENYVHHLVQPPVVTPISIFGACVGSHNPIHPNGLPLQSTGRSGGVEPYGPDRANVWGFPR
jgi:hypothetical protein